MKCPEEWPRLSPFGMRRSPHKRGKAVSTKPSGSAPVHGKGYTGDHSGNVPEGKRKKHDRFPTGTPGTPSGTCIILKNPNCQCGKHYASNGS